MQAQWWEIGCQHLGEILELFVVGFLDVVFGIVELNSPNICKLHKTQGTTMFLVSFNGPRLEVVYSMD